MGLLCTAGWQSQRRKSHVSADLSETWQALWKDINATPSETTSHRTHSLLARYGFDQLRVALISLSFTQVHSSVQLLGLIEVWKAVIEFMNRSNEYRFPFNERINNTYVSSFCFIWGSRLWSKDGIGEQPRNIKQGNEGQNDQSYLPRISERNDETSNDSHDTWHCKSELGSGGLE